MNPLFFKDDWKTITAELLVSIINLYSKGNPTADPVIAADPDYSDLDIGKNGNIHIDYIRSKVNTDKRILVSYAYLGSQKDSQHTQDNYYYTNISVTIRDLGVLSGAFQDISELMNKISSLMWCLDTPRYWQIVSEGLFEVTKLKHNYQVSSVEITELDSSFEAQSEIEYNFRIRFNLIS